MLQTSIANANPVVFLFHNFAVVTTSLSTPPASEEAQTQHGDTVMQLFEEPFHKS